MRTRAKTTMLTLLRWKMNEYVKSISKLYLIYLTVPLKSSREEKEVWRSGVGRGKYDKQYSVDHALKDSIRKHIDSITKIESHYCRADSSRVNIDGGKTIADLHLKYVSECKSKGLPRAN